MAEPQLFKIEDCWLGLSIVDTAAAGYQEGWNAPGGLLVDAVTIDDYVGTDTFRCQLTSGALTPSPNVTSETVPATGCGPARSIPTVGETSYAFDTSFLQDPHIVNGVSRYLFEHDTEEAYFFYGMGGDNPPRVIGRCRIVAGALGGAMRTTLTMDISLPVTRKPDVEFGNATDSEVVPGATPYKGAAAPGDVFPAEATITAEDAPNAAELAGLGYVAVPQTAWTVGQSMTVGAFEFSWSGTVWEAGPA